MGLAALSRSEEVSVKGAGLKARVGHSKGPH